MIGTEAEQSVIGAVIGSKDAYRFAAEIIGPEDFTHPDLGEIFMLVKELSDSGVELNLVTVGTEVSKRKLRGVAVADVAGWFHTDGTTGSVQYYAKEVRDHAIRRSASGILSQASLDLTDLSHSPGQVLATLTNSLADLRAGKSEKRIDAKPLGEIMSQKDEFDWVIPGILERRDRVVITAGEGAGKTTFIRQMSIAAASGVNPISFLPTEPIRVLVIDAENSEKQWRRQAKGMVRRGQYSGDADPEKNVFLACSPRMDITSDKWLGAIHRVIDDCDPSMVCIGPLYRLVQRNMNGEEDMAQILAALDTIRDRGIALIVEAHAGHAKNAAGDRDLRPRGSSSLMGWPEFGFGLARDPSNEHGVMLSRWRGDREERDWPDGFDRGGPWPWTDSLMLPAVRAAAEEPSPKNALSA